MYSEKKNKNCGRNDKVEKISDRLDIEFEKEKQ